MSDPFAPFQPGSPPATITNVAYSGGTLLANAGTITLPYPHQKSGAAAQLAFPWVVIANNTGSPMRVAAAQQDLGLVPPGSMDKFNLGLAAQASGVTLIPQQFGVPGGFVFGSWFYEEPPGDYPSGFSAPTLTNGMAPTETVIAAAFGPIFVPLLLPTSTPGIADGDPAAWGVGVRLETGAGVADGLMLTMLDGTTGGSGTPIWKTTYPTQFAPWWRVPVHGAPSVLQIDPMLGKVIGANWGGIVVAAAIPGVVDPSLGIGPVLSIGDTFTVSCPGGATTPLISAPNSGEIAQVRFISVSFPAAPAANLSLQLVGSNSGAVYWQSASIAAANTPVPSSGSCNFLVGSGNLGPFDDPAEGLSFVNNTAQAAQVNIAANILPWPQVPGVFLTN